MVSREGVYFNIVLYIGNVFQTVHGVETRWRFSSAAAEHRAHELLGDVNHELGPRLRSPIGSLKREFVRRKTGWYL